MKWREISRATKLLSRIFKIVKNSKFSEIFKKIFKISPLKIKIFKKPYNMLEVNSRWICVQNFKSISSKMAEIWHNTCQKQALFTSFRDFNVIFRILFLDRFWRFKKCIRAIFSRSLRKSDLKTCIAALNHEFFLLDLFHLVTWHDLDLYYGRKAQ